LLLENAKLDLQCRLLDVGSASGFCGRQKAPDGAIPLRAMLPFRPFQNECAGVSEGDEFRAALDFDDLGSGTNQPWLFLFGMEVSVP
jgi:hypothetical protein